MNGSKNKENEYWTGVRIKKISQLEFRKVLNGSKNKENELLVWKYESMEYVSMKVWKYVSMPVWWDANMPVYIIMT